MDKIKITPVSRMPLTAAFGWEAFKLNSDGMVPVIVQDVKNDEVLMLAYMNQPDDILEPQQRRALDQGVDLRACTAGKRALDRL